MSAASLGDILTGHILIQATGSIFVVSDLELVDGTNLTLEAWENIVVSAGMTGVNDLEIRADVDDNGTGNIQIFAPSLSADGDIVFTGNVIELRGASVDAGGRVTFGGDTLISGEQHVSGEEVEFLGAVDGMTDASLFVDADVFAGFSDEVGMNGALMTLEVVAPQILMMGGTVYTSGDQLYDGAVIMDGDHDLFTLSGGDVTFLGSIDSATGLGATPAALTIWSNGVTTLAGDIGQNAALTSLVTREQDGSSLDLDAGVMLGGDVNAGNVEFRDAVMLTSDVAIDASNSVRFLGGADGGGNSLSVDTPSSTVNAEAWRTSTRWPLPAA